MPNLSAMDVANYFLAQTSPEEDGESISNLKLQKLLYYSQGFSLALNNSPIFSDPIQAWTHGPVVPIVYHAFKGHGGSAIPTPDNVVLEKFSEEEREVLDEVYRELGQYSAWKLREMTHNEPPWIEARKRSEEVGGGAVITKKSMREYFGTLIVSDDEES